ncbi:Regulator of G-protein signaling 6 [Phlyctochytrium bullatum]|nr:Regulator of G-protein signaling 6 [Phlyctochytrium bullatum]
MERFSRNNSSDDTAIPAQAIRNRPSTGVALSRSMSNSSSQIAPGYMPNNSQSLVAHPSQVAERPNHAGSGSVADLSSQHSLVGELNTKSTPVNSADPFTRAKKRASMTSSHFQKIIPSPLTDGSVADNVATTSTTDLDDDGDGANYSPIPSRPSQARRKVDMRRLAMYEDVVLRLRDPNGGIELKDRSRMFKQYPQTFLGSELTEWLINNCNLLTKDEGTRFATNLFETGYIISVDLNEKFTPDSSVYVFQTSYFWASIRFAPSDKDYLAYLLRRNQRTTAKYQLTDVEERRLVKLKRKFRKHREEVEALVKEQNETLNNIFEITSHIDLLSKTERRLFSLQEYAFWRMQRPLEPGVTYLPTKEDSALEKRSQTEAQYEAKLTDAERLVFWEKKRDIFDASLSLNRVKVSTAARAKEPTRHDLLVWCHSLSDLLRDPLGVEYFGKFLKTEFSTENLEFHLRVEALGSIPSYRDFLAEAEAIFDEFIQVGSPRELNITSGCRSLIIQQFTAVRNIAIQQSQAASTVSLGATSIVSTYQPAITVQTNVAASAPVSSDPPAGAVPSTPTPITASPLSPPAVGGGPSANGSSLNLQNSSMQSLPQSTTTQSFSAYSRKQNMQIAGRLSNFVFKEAQEHIIQLMAKDSYNRFLASNMLQSLLAREGIDQDLLASLGLGAVKGNMSRRNLAMA